MIFMVSLWATGLLPIFPDPLDHGSDSVDRVQRGLRDRAKSPLRWLESMRPCSEGLFRSHGVPKVLRMPACSSEGSQRAVNTIVQPGRQIRARRGCCLDFHNEKDSDCGCVGA